MERAGPRLGGHALARVARRGRIWLPQKHHHKARSIIHNRRQVCCLPGHLCLPCSTGLAAGQRSPGSGHLGCPPPLPAKAYARGHHYCSHYDCTDQPAEAQPAPPSGAGGSSAANAGANPQPQPTASQDNGNGKLLPQLNRLHEAFKRSQVSPPALNSSQDQQPARPSAFPSQRRLTLQFTK